MSLSFYILQKACSINKCLIFVFLTILLLNSTINANPVQEADMTSIEMVVSEIYTVNTSNMSVELLTGGASGDRLYLVKVDDRQLLLRIYKTGKSLEGRKLEVSCTKIASDLGLGPKFLYVSKDFDILATDFVVGDSPTIDTFAKVH